MKQKRTADGKFGERLRSLRTERCLTMEQLCEQFNRQFDAKLNRCTISRYEHGVQEPMLNTVELLAKFFGVSPVYLMGQSESRYSVEHPEQRSRAGEQRGHFDRPERRLSGARTFRDGGRTSPHPRSARRQKSDGSDVVRV